MRSVRLTNLYEQSNLDFLHNWERVQQWWSGGYWVWWQVPHNTPNHPHILITQTPFLRIRSRVSEALSDKLYVSPALDTASWCNETGYTAYLYVHKVLVSTNWVSDVMPGALTETSIPSGHWPLAIALPGNVHGHEPEFKVPSLVIERMDEYMFRNSLKWQQEGGRRKCWLCMIENA